MGMSRRTLFQAVIGVSSSHLERFSKQRVAVSIRREVIDAMKGMYCKLEMEPQASNIC